MNAKGEICIGMVGAGRAAEIHMNALQRLGDIPLCKKHIVAKRWEQVNEAKEKYKFLKASLDFNDILNDDEIDIVDICTPPYVHEKMIIDALNAGKNVICEKPLTGYFGDTVSKNVGFEVPKTEMYEQLLKTLERIQNSVALSKQKFMYAENFIYAPAIRKAAEILKKKKSKILFAKGEESLKGSSSHVAGEWSKNGGGTFIRTGSHPLTAILWLKAVEAKARGENIKPVRVLADMAQITPMLNEYEHRHIAARPIDVEDFGTAIITFSDGTKASITATDTLLGGSRNYVELYCNDVVINCKLTLSDLMDTYFLDEDRLDDVYISEMLPSKIGWNHPFIEDEVIRGYAAEMRDFIEAVHHDKQPDSGFDIAYITTKVIYAAYKSAEIGMPVDLE